MAKENCWLTLFCKLEYDDTFSTMAVIMIILMRSSFILCGYTNWLILKGDWSKLCAKKKPIFQFRFDWSSEKTSLKRFERLFFFQLCSGKRRLTVVSTMKDLCFSWTPFIIKMNDVKESFKVGCHYISHKTIFLLNLICKSRMV